MSSMARLAQKLFEPLNTAVSDHGGFTVLIERMDAMQGTSPWDGLVKGHSAASCSDILRCSSSSEQRRSSVLHISHRTGLPAIAATRVDCNLKRGAAIPSRVGILE